MSITDSSPGAGKLFNNGPDSIFGFVGHVVSVVTFKFAFVA